MLLCCVRKRLGAGGNNRYLGTHIRNQSFISFADHSCCRSFLQTSRAYINFNQRSERTIRTQLQLHSESLGKFSVPRDPTSSSLQQSFVEIHR